MKHVFWVIVVSLLLAIPALSFLPRKLYARNVKQPRVTGISPTAVKPGDMITITGEEFEYSYEEYCDGFFGTRSQAKCHPKSVIAAYKAPRTHADYPGSKPDFRLAIISLSPNSAQVQVPASISSGDGTYNLGWFWEYDQKESQDQAGQLVGFARYDSINVTGAGTGSKTIQNTASKPTATPKPQLSHTPTVSLTQSNTSPTPVPSVKISTNIPDKPTTPKSTNNPVRSIFQSVISFFQSLFRLR